MPRDTRLRLAALLMLPMLLTSTSPAAEYTPRKRVLIIESFGLPPATAGAVAFRKTLERELGQPVDIYQTSLDAARFTGPEHEAELGDFLRSRYKEHKLDLVAPMQAPAVQFVARERERLFAGTPVLATGLERRRIPTGPRTSTALVVGESDLPGQIENILQLLPDTRRIAMLYGASSYDKFWLEQSRRELQRFAGRVEITWFEGLSLEDIRQQVAKLPAGSVVFLGLFVLDAAGIQHGRDEVLERVREVSKVPIFGFFESNVGRGIVGGRLYPDATLGAEAARVAIRILRGEALDTNAPSVIPLTRPIFDGRELKRFGIADDRLPPDSEVLYRQQTVWQAYRWHIAATVALLILQAAFIAGLVMQRAQHRRAEAERKRAEAALLHTRAELAHMTRVSTIGELSGSLAHELNQPLTAILSNAQAAQRFLATDDPANLADVREILGDIVAADKRAAEVIRRLRSMIKKDDLTVTRVDLAGAVREVVLLLHNDAMLRHVHIALEVEPYLPAVLGDRVQLQQVVLNLLLNAFDAVKELDVGERMVLLAVGRDDQNMLKMTVTDFGRGLAEDSVERIFEAFFTTKANGLGMGLSISRSIVEAHRGRLWAENNRSRGATFCFTVPLATS